MSIKREFSRFANEYDNYSIIQKQVVKDLFDMLKFKPKKILDIGCGRGGVCSAISWDYESFLAVDFSSKMLELHPNSPSIQKIQADFNSSDFFDTLDKNSFDFVFSASALQWADDIDEVIGSLKNLQKPLALAIFTSGTFESLHKCAGVKPLLKSADELEKIVQKHLNTKVQIKNYKLEFDSTLKALRYIKKSGVNSTKKPLSYKEMQELIANYPLNYLEFEVVFVYYHPYL